MYTDRITLAEEYWNIAEPYALADKFCMHDLQNALADHLRTRQVSHFISPKWVEYVWELAEGSKMSQHALDKLHYDVVTDPGEYTVADGQYTKDFHQVVETCQPVATALIWKFIDQSKGGGKSNGKGKLQDPASMSGCVYHVHKAGEKCKASG